MKIEDIREMDNAGIQAAIGKAEINLMTMRMKNTIGNNENPLEIRAQRRTVARMKTVLQERALKIR